MDLDFGKVIALAGDFYTNREGFMTYYPICDAEFFGITQWSKSTLHPFDRFENAVNSLLHDTDGYLATVQEFLDQEHDAVEMAQQKGKDVAQA